MLRAVVFDYDGVLVESVEVKTQAYATLFAHEEPEAIRQILAYHMAHLGVSRLEKFQYAYRTVLRRELSAEQLAQLCRRFSDLVKPRVLAAEWVAGALESLEDCRKMGLPAFIVSGTPQDELSEIVEGRKIGSYFSGVYGSPRSKPELIRSILATCHFSADEVLFVGDALTDFCAAQETGVRFVIRSSYEDRGCWRERGAKWIPNLRPLPSILRQMSEGPIRPGYPVPS